MKPARPRLAGATGDAVGVAPHEASRPLLDRLLWICPAIGLFAAGLILWLVGLSWWTILAIALLVACPATVAWALFVGRRRGPSAPGQSRGWLSRIARRRKGG
jgi:hypothetical protein